MIFFKKLIISNNKFFNFNGIIICLFPVFLISGPFLSDFSATYLGLSFLLYCILTKQIEYFKNYYFFFFLLIYFYLNLNSLIGFDYSISLKSSVPFLRMILFIFSVSFIVQKFSNIKFIYLKVFFLCIFCLLLYSFYIIFFHQDLFGNPIVDTIRITSLFGTEEIMGSYVARLLPLTVALLYFVVSKLRQIAIYVIIFFSGILIFMSGERTSLAYFLLFLTFYLFVINKKQIFSILLIIFLVFGITFSINPKSINRIVLHSAAQMKSDQALVVFSFRHTLHYLSAYEMFLNSPAVGHGLKSFRHICDKFNRNVGLFIYQNSKNKNTEEKEILSEYPNGCNTHPHNIYFEFLSELGVIGFFLFGSIFAYIGYQILILLKLKFVKKKTLSNKQKCLYLILAGIFTTMFPILPSGSYFNNWILAISYLPIGFYLGIKASK
jgi:O-antigen ligase